MIICGKSVCSGCAACQEICPTKCISFEQDDLGAQYPRIDVTKCVECGLCHRICPNNTSSIYHYPIKSFAAWSNDVEVRRTSASGGIATELYKLFQAEGGRCAGVVYNVEDGAKYQFIDTEQDLQSVKNSKYTYSYTNGVYCAVKKELDRGKEVLFIGLPCQIAGLLNFLKKTYSNLYTVDIICHGVAPTPYIQQHVKNIEYANCAKTTDVIFRDPSKGTHKFFLAIYDEDKCFYINDMCGIDLYQIGYHRALIYRENCYSCIYARAERVGDLTIGDFSGLGRDAYCEYDSIGVSCILANTDKGIALLERLSSRISIFERPLSEALNYEKQLRSPSIKHPKRTMFEERYRMTADFKDAASCALKEDIRELRLAKISPMPYLRRAVRAITTRKFRTQMKKILMPFR